MLDKCYLQPAFAVEMLLEKLSGYITSVEKQRIEECYGRVAASDILSPEDLPGFARATMDGYALKAADTYAAKETIPACLKISGEVFMGENPGFEIISGQAAKIPTGGMIPPGADAVVMLEHTRSISDDTIEILEPVAQGENAIKRDGDTRKGSVVIRKGRKLRAQDVGALAGTGITSIDVFKKPIVNLLSTGDEIVPADCRVSQGQVRDINSFTLSGLISEEGGVVYKKWILKDDYNTIRNCVEQSLQEADLIVIIGGTSAGTRDMTAKIIDDIGNPGVLFHGVAVKPCKPLIGGIVQDKPVLGLPGHPAAAVVSFNLFIAPLIRRLSGADLSPRFMKTVRARMGKCIVSAAGREDHIRVYVEHREGELEAIPIFGKSGLITTLVNADGIVIIPSSKLGIDKGESVTVNLF
ncbi:MAG TPA: gephyrin-like molybdotransferase Glp [Dissulfurispiraceae bacterium]|nr:gephyrin-like molybdotransferase Glp [Dissulfurispiraceae bacterium]